MKFSGLFSKHILTLSVLFIIMLLPGCALFDWFSGKGSKGTTQEGQEALKGSEVIVSMDGKPLVTPESLKKDKADLMASNPQLKMMIPHMDEKQFDKTLTDGLTNQAVIERYIQENGLDQSKEYQDELALMMKSIKHMFNNKVFSAQLKPAVTDADVTEFYEKNKNTIPSLMISQGGVKAVGVEFDNEAAAKEFATKVQAANHNVQKAAQGTKLADKVKDFKLVHDQSIGLDQTLKAKIVATTAIPSTTVHKVSDKSFFVVAVTGKENPTYQPLDKIKNELRQYLEKEKLTELVDKEITSLRKKYNIVVNEAYFAPAKEEKTEEAAAHATEQPVEEFESQAAGQQ